MGPVEKQYFITFRPFHFRGHKVEKTESRSKIVAKSQQSLLNKSNRKEIRSFLSSYIDRLDYKRFAHVYCVFSRNTIHLITFEMHLSQNAWGACTFQSCGKHTVKTDWSKQPIFLAPSFIKLSLWPIVNS